MAKISESMETKNMSAAALVCRSQGHSLEGLNTALPAKLKGASAQVTLRCLRYNPKRPTEPQLCGYEVDIEISLRNGQLVSRRSVYTDASYLRATRGQGRLPRDDTRAALLARLVDG